MPQFIIQGWDKPNSLELRVATRPAHLEYAASGEVTVLLAGPMLSDEGMPIGSMFVIEARDRAAAEHFAANDPYKLAGLFERVDIISWRKVLPA